MSTGLARFSLIFWFSSVPDENFVMVCVNSTMFSRKDNCEKFAHAFAMYIGLEVEK